MARLVLLLLLILPLTLHQPLWAAPGPEGDQKVSMTAGPRKQLANIVFAGLAGAVLGLSTLSFYGRPQDKLVNIPIGFAFGVVGGAIFSTYRAVSDPKEFYGLEHQFDIPQSSASLASYTFEF